MGKVVLGSSFHRDFCPIIIFLDYSKNYLVGNKTNWATWKYLLSKRVVWQDNKSYSAVLFLGYGTEIKFHDCGAVLSPPPLPNPAPDSAPLVSLGEPGRWAEAVQYHFKWCYFWNQAKCLAGEDVEMFIHCWKLVSLHISPRGQSDINLWSPTTWS